MHVEEQCDSENGCGLCDIGMELMGCVSFHEFSCEPEKKSAGSLPSLSDVCLCWFSDNCH